MGRGKNFRMARQVPPSRQGLREPQQDRPSFPPPGVNSTDVEKTLFKCINFPDGLSDRGWWRGINRGALNIKEYLKNGKIIYLSKKNLKNY